MSKKEKKIIFIIDRFTIIEMAILNSYYSYCPVYKDRSFIDHVKA